MREVRRRLLFVCAALSAGTLTGAGCLRVGLDPLPRVEADDAGADADADADADTDAPPVVVTMVVEDDLDDGELDGSGYYGEDGYAPQGESSCWTYLGGYDPTALPGDGETVSFFRFALPRVVPAGSRITEARLRLYGRDVWHWRPAEHTLGVYLERSADARRVSSIDDLPKGGGEGRPLLGVYVLWGVAGGEELHWRVDDWNESPDLSPVFQALVRERSGLAEGAHVQLFLFRDEVTSDGEVAAEDFCHPASNEATLRLGWSPSR